MARFRVLAKTHLRPTAREGRNGEQARLYEAGETVEYDEPSGPTLEPLDEEARAIHAVELFTKALRPGLGGAHMAKLAWAKSIGITAPKSVAEAEAAIAAFVAIHHPDANIRARMAA